jgi:DNA polymerase-3 subunit beta
MFKISIYKKEFINAINNVVSATKVTKASNKGLEVLSHIHCVVKDSYLYLYSTNCELELTSRVACQNMLTEDCEAFLLPAAKIRDIVKSMPNDSVIEITPNEKEEFKHIVKCVGQRSRYTLVGLDPSIMPINSDIKDVVNEVLIESSELHYALMSVFNFSASNDTRYYLNGINFKIKDGEVSLCATDGHRLSVFGVKAECTQDVKTETGYILSKDCATELIKSLANVSGRITLKFYESNIKFEVEGYSFSSLLIDGKYPDTNRVIPRGNTNNITINSSDLLEAVNRSSILMDTTSKIGRFNFSSTDIMIETDSNGESSVEQIDVQSQSGDEVQNIGFNLNYISAAVKAIDREYIKISFKDSMTSILISAPDKPSHIAVVMPARV